jgi:2-methylcitrate dehydratase
LCTLVGGGRTAPDRAAFLNGALIRYLDFNDSYLAPGESCHPSDSLGAILAAVEYRQGNGRDLLTALAVAYQVQCRLSDEAPVRARGFDHTVQGAYAVAAGVSRALGLDAERTAHALALAGTSLNALRVTRTGVLSHWKGLAYAAMSSGALQAAFLAMRGITGPREVFEGNKGFIDSLAGPFSIDWSREELDRAPRTILKKYDAEVHAQSALEGVLELRSEVPLDPAEVEAVEIDVFDVAFHIIGGGEEGDKKVVRTKEDADHSLPYMVAAALLDGEVMPEQYGVRRLSSPDIQSLMKRVVVRPDPALTARFPAEHACRIRVRLRDGRVVSREKRDYEGFHTRPLPWERVVEKFERLSSAAADGASRRAILEAVGRLEDIPVADLMAALDWAVRVRKGDVA